jgi:hypothetical protein
LTIAHGTVECGGEGEADQPDQEDEEDEEDALASR